VLLKKSLFNCAYLLSIFITVYSTLFFSSAITCFSQSNNQATVTSDVNLNSTIEDSLSDFYFPPQPIVFRYENNISCIRATVLAAMGIRVPEALYLQHLWLSASKEQIVNYFEQLEKKYLRGIVTKPSLLNAKGFGTFYKGETVHVYFREPDTIEVVHFLGHLDKGKKLPLSQIYPLLKLEDKDSLTSLYIAYFLNEMGLRATMINIPQHLSKSISIKEMKAFLKRMIGKRYYGLMLSPDILATKGITTLLKGELIVINICNATQIEIFSAMHNDSRKYKISIDKLFQNRKSRLMTPLLPEFP